MNRFNGIIVAVIIVCCCLFLIHFLVGKSHNSSRNSTDLFNNYSYKMNEILEDEDMSDSEEEVNLDPIENFNSLKSHKNYKLFNNEMCGISSAEVRITGGEVTKLMANPWMVAIVYRKKDLNQTILHCGGSLISEKLVLTAAHCFRRRKRLSIRLGEYNLKTDPDCTTDPEGDTTCADKVQEITDFTIIKHKHYHETTDDIALIRLNKPAALHQNNIKTVCLPFHHDDNVSIPRFYVTGWGRTQNDKNTTSDILLGTFVNNIPNEECQKRLGTTLWRGHMCTGDNGKSDSCKGDSGGPLVRLVQHQGSVRTFQFGVVSFGLVGGCGNAPGVYTRVYHYLRWILDNAGK